MWNSNIPLSCIVENTKFKVEQFYSLFIFKEQRIAPLGYNRQCFFQNLRRHDDATSTVRRLIGEMRIPLERWPVAWRSLVEREEENQPAGPYLIPPPSPDKPARIRGLRLSPGATRSPRSTPKRSRAARDEDDSSSAKKAEKDDGEAEQDSDEAPEPRKKSQKTSGKAVGSTRCVESSEFIITNYLITGFSILVS